MHLEGLFDFGENMAEFAGLYALSRPRPARRHHGFGVSVHWIADPDHWQPRLAYRAHQRRQAAADGVRAEA